MPTIPMPTPADIAALRRRRDLTYAEFAAEIGVAISTVFRWERGDARPRGLALKALAHQFKRYPPAKD